MKRNKWKLVIMEYEMDALDECIIFLKSEAMYPDDFILINKLNALKMKLERLRATK